MNNYNWGSNEPIILPAEDGGDKTNTFGVKVKKLFEDLFSKLNSDFDEVDNTFLKRSGGTMSGTIRSENIVPTFADTYGLGTNAKPYKDLHVLSIDVESEAGKTAFTIDGTTGSILPASGSQLNIGSASAPVGVITAQELTVPTATITKLVTTGGITGNASTATKLATPVNVNGTLFDGSREITTSKWGTARNMYIRDASGTNTGVAVSVNGSGDAYLKLPQVIKVNVTGNVTGNLTGTADKATRFATDRTISLTGGATANAVTFNGTGNAVLNVTSLDASKLKGTIPDGVSVGTGNAMRPNYSDRVAIGDGANFTAPKNGVAILSLRNTNGGGTVMINNVTFVSSATVDWNSKTERLMFTFPLSKGDVIRCTQLLSGWFVGVK